MNVNKVILLGRLTERPEPKTTTTGKQVLNTRVEVTKRLDDGREIQQKIAVVIWGKQADFLGQHAAQGSTVYIEGELTNRSYDKNGTTVWVTEVVANRVQMMWEDRPAGMTTQTDGWESFGVGGNR